MQGKREREMRFYNKFMHSYSYFNKKNNNKKFYSASFLRLLALLKLSRWSGRVGLGWVAGCLLDYHLDTGTKKKEASHPSIHPSIRSNNNINFIN